MFAPVFFFFFVFVLAYISTNILTTVQTILKQPCNNMIECVIKRSLATNSSGQCWLVLTHSISLNLTVLANWNSLTTMSITTRTVWHWSSICCGWMFPCGHFSLSICFLSGHYYLHYDTFRAIKSASKLPLQISCDTLGAKLQKKKKLAVGQCSNENSIQLNSSW